MSLKINLFICRQALSLRLQQMMQAHCDEAIKLLKSSATKLSPISGTRQVFSTAYHLHFEQCIREYVNATARPLKIRIKEEHMSRSFLAKNSIF